MIKTLSLSPDFRKWSWEQSNGNATLEQMRESYGTLMDYGRCSEFSRHVWNDIVDMTANALSGAGVEWDSTYCTAEECKIATRHGVLMAYAWNSVTHNIKRLGFVAWKWARKGNYPGYLGRTPVYGFSTHGVDSDYLYAWYLFEITKKLNKLISVLQDEADFSELGKSERSATTTIAKMSAPRITATSSTLVSESDLIGLVNGFPSRPFVSKALMSQSGQISEGEVLRVSPMEKKDASFSYYKAQSISRGVASAKSTQESLSKYVAENISRHAAPGKHASESFAPYTAASNTGRAAPGETILHSLTFGIHDLKANQIAKASSVLMSESRTEGEAFASMSKFVEAINASESDSNGVTTALESKPLKASQESKIISFAEAKIMGMKACAAAVQSESMVEAALSFYTKETWYDPVRNGNNLYIRSVYRAFDEDTNVHVGHKFLEAERDGANLHLQSVYSATQEETNINIGSVFYEVEQTGSNVHIRSVGSLKGE